jgi:hypothetical protein
MFLNIKLFFVVLVITSATYAQETETEQTTETNQETKASGRKVGSVTMGAYVPFVFGDNFVNNAIDIGAGARISVKINALEDFYIGPYFSFFTGNVTDQELLGNYDKSNNFVFGAIVGYEKQVNKFDLSIGVGVGSSIYSNRRVGDNFSDTGTAVWLSPEVSYRFSTYLAVFVAPELRHDFMNIDVPNELEDTFGSVNYFNVGFGLRINLGTAYKYL